MVRFFAGCQRNGFHNLALEVDLDGLAWSLFGKQGMVISQPAAVQNLRAFAHVIPDDLLFARDLTCARGFAAISIDNVAAGQNLKENTDARRPVLPNQFAIFGDFDQPIRPLAVFCEQNLVAGRLLLADKHG